MRTPYIKSAVQWAREHGTDNLEAEEYFSRVWALPADQAAIAAEMLLD